MRKINDKHFFNIHTVNNVTYQLLTKITQIPESAKTDKHPDYPDQVLAK